MALEVFVPPDFDKADGWPDCLDFVVLVAGYEAAPVVESSEVKSATLSLAVDQFWVIY